MLDDLGMTTCLHFVQVSSSYSISLFLLNKFQLSVCMQHRAYHKSFSLFLSSTQVTHSAKMYEVILTIAASAIRRPSDLILVSEKNNSRSIICCCFHGWSIRLKCLFLVKRAVVFATNPVHVQFIANVPTAAHSLTSSRTLCRVNTPREKKTHCARSRVNLQLVPPAHATATLPREGNVLYPLALDTCFMHKPILDKEKLHTSHLSRSSN